MLAHTSPPQAPDAVAVGDLSRPLVYYSPSEHTWRLAQDFHRTIDGRHWFIRAPYDFDMASIPRVLWGVLASHELGVLAPLCHDFLYRCGGCPPDGCITPAHAYTRLEADRLFLRQMEEDGVSWIRRRAAYTAVRLFGRTSWRGK